jgi:hypothetical protein
MTSIDARMLDRELKKGSAELIVLSIVEPRAVTDTRSASSLRRSAGPGSNDWKPMSAVGPDVREIRIRVDGAHRVFYVATFDRQAARGGCRRSGNDQPPSVEES